MKAVARAFLIFLGFLFIGGAVLVAAINYKLIPGLAVPVTLPGWVGENILIFAGVVLLLIALILISLGLRLSKKVGNAILKDSEFGAVSISITAVENMVLRVIQQTRGIKDVSRKVIPAADGLIIKVVIRAMPDVSLPGVINELQSKIKEYVEEITGIAVKEVQVTVDNIVTDQAVSKK